MTESSLVKMAGTRLGKKSSTIRRCRRRDMAQLVQASPLGEKEYS